MPFEGVLSLRLRESFFLHFRWTISSIWAVSSELWNNTAFGILQIFFLIPNKVEVEGKSYQFYDFQVVDRPAKPIISHYLQILFTFLMRHNILKFECFDKLTFFKPPHLKYILVN